MNLLGYLLALVAGACNAIQPGMNGQLRRSLDHVVAAAGAVYVVGLVGLVLCAPLDRERWPSLDKAAQVPWWAWLAGILGVGSNVVAALFAKKLGSAVFTGGTITAALVCSVILDHMGWIGFEPHPANLWRIAGLALMIAGLLLVSRF